MKPALRVRRVVTVPELQCHVEPTDDLRYSCMDCGPGQTVTAAYEPYDARMTGSTNVLRLRCGGCRCVIKGRIGVTRIDE